MTSPTHSAAQSPPVYGVVVSPVEEPRRGIRLSSMATTGWTHWFHGEQWLFQDGILRDPIGSLKTICLVGDWAERRNPTSSILSADEFNRFASIPRNLWIPREDITCATLRRSHGFSTLDLCLQMSDGRPIQLLTPERRQVDLWLQSLLQEW